MRDSSLIITRAGWVGLACTRLFGSRKSHSCWTWLFHHVFEGLPEHPDSLAQFRGVLFVLADIGGSFAIRLRLTRITSLSFRFAVYLPTTRLTGRQLLYLPCRPSPFVWPSQAVIICDISAVHILRTISYHESGCAATLCSCVVTDRTSSHHTIRNNNVVNNRPISWQSWSFGQISKLVPTLHNYWALSGVQGVAAHTHTYSTGVHNIGNNENQYWYQIIKSGGFLYFLQNRNRTSSSRKPSLHNLLSCRPQNMVPSHS